MSPCPQSLPTRAAKMRRNGIWELEQSLLQALAGGANASTTRWDFAPWDATSLGVQTASRSRRRPIYYGERSWNSLKLMSCLQPLDPGGFTSTTYATSRSDRSKGILTKREENPPLTSVISVQRNKLI